MKKLLAILLALMLVLVSAAALADDPANDNNQNGNGSANGDAKAAADANILAEQDPTAAATYKNTSDANDPNNGKEIGNKPAPMSVTIKKAYTVTGSAAVMPGHTLTFTTPTQVKVENSTSGNFPSTNVSIGAVEVAAGTENGTKLPLTITLPTYTEPGVYTYTFKENDGSELTQAHTVAGVQYNTKTYELKVTVVEGSALAAGGITASGLVIGGVALRELNTTTKIDTIENEYVAGSVTVGKTVTGNLGDRKRPFSFSIVFKAGTEYVDAPITYTETTYNANGTKTTTDKTIAKGWTGDHAAVTFQLIHGDSITFSNVPEGVEYAVTETAVDGYITTTPTNATGTIKKAEAERDVTVTFVNDKSITIDTGVALDSSAYILIMALALVGVTVLAIRRREEY